MLGRNPVLECLRAGVPATALYIALGTEADQRLTESVSRAGDLGIAILEVPRTDLDRLTANHLHQGIALQVPPYNYAHPDDLVAAATKSPPALLVALDNISDPRNLGAIVRSVAAFGGHGVMIPQRRSASVTAVAWRTSAGAASRVPVARATNLTRALQDWANKGLRVIGLDADGDTAIDDVDGTDPLVLVVGSEGKGLSRLVRQNCDEVVSIPMAGQRRIAERLGGSRGGAGRNRPPAQDLTALRVHGTASAHVNMAFGSKLGEGRQVVIEPAPGSDDTLHSAAQRLSHARTCSQVEVRRASLAAYSSLCHARRPLQALPRPQTGDGAQRCIACRRSRRG